MMGTNYTKEHDSWIHSNMGSHIESFSASEKERLTKLFNVTFDNDRTWISLHGRAKRIGARPRRVHAIVGVTTKSNGRGDCVQVYVGNNKYVPKSRYMYELYTGEKLSHNDVVRFRDGDVTNFDADNLVKLSRSEHLRFNKIDANTPFDTRVLLAKVTSELDNLEGRGDWSAAEIEWVLEHGGPGKGHNFWVRLAEKFNKRFNKNRTNRCLLMRWYHNA